MKVFDLSETPLRDVNQWLHDLPSDGDGYEVQVSNPRGLHAIACGIDAPVTVRVDGHVGYYCGGMNKQGHVVIDGNAGQGVAENMMSGVVHVKGDASQSAGATAHGGTLIIDGNASARCGISMKGVDIVVQGSIGHMSAFMAQKGNLLVLGDAGEALGDSVYEANIFVRGNVKSLGADCIEKEFDTDTAAICEGLLSQAGIDNLTVSDFKRFGSARELYHFKTHNVGVY